MPHYYEFGSLEDFLNNREKIQPTKRKKLHSLFSFPPDSALVTILTSVIYNHVDSSTGRISDLTGASLDVKIDDRILDKQSKAELKEGMRLYKPGMYYNVRDGTSFLERYQTQGPIYSALECRSCRL